MSELEDEESKRVFCYHERNNNNNSLSDQGFAPGSLVFLPA